MFFDFDEHKKLMMVRSPEYITRDDLETFLEQAVSLHHKHGKLNLLLDWSEHWFSSSDVEKAGLYASAQMKTMFSKIAVLCNPQHREVVDSWKAATGLNLRVFTSNQQQDLFHWLGDS